MTRIYALLLIFALGAAAYGCSAQDEIYGKKISELPETAKMDWEGDTVRYWDGSVMLDATYLPPSKLELYFSKFRGGRYENPFPGNAYIVFSVGVRDTGKSDVTFNPRMTMFIIESNAPATPKDFSSLYTDLSLVEAEDIDMRMEAFRASSYDTSEVLRPGETVRKLLVFPRAEGAEKGGVILFNGVYVAHKNLTIPVVYDRPL